MRLRRPVPEDAARIAAIEGRSFPLRPWALDTVRAELARAHGVALLAERSGQAAGYALGWSVAGEAELTRIAMDPPARGQGLGAALLQGWMAACQRSGATVIFLEVRADNTPAQNLYRRAGFVEAGRRRGYYADGADALVLRWALEGGGC